MLSFLHRFHGPCRFLAHALHTGGVNGAQKALNRLRGAHAHSPLASFLDTLCENEAFLDQDTHALTTKPLVCLFPDAFQCDLLCLLHLVHPLVPRGSLLALLRCMAQDLKQKPWVWALMQQLRRDIKDEEFGGNTLLTPECELRLKGLCSKFRDAQARGGWELYLKEGRAEQPVDTEVDSVHRKRKGEVIEVHVDTEVEPEAKRMRMDVSDGEDTEREVKETPPRGGSSPGQQPPPPLSVLPEHLKAAVPSMKELLESEMEWDESAVPVLRPLHECDSDQMEMLCGVLCLAEVPEQTLPHFCSFLLNLSPDLSHSSSSVIVRHLLLGKVLSLTEPASRSLVTAVTSLCSRYPRPTCQALIEPVVKEGQTGGAQAELLCRLVKDCLEPHHRLLVFRMTLAGFWNEALLSVIHALLDSKIELNEELFTLLINQLSSQSPHFTKSVKFAKMILTVLTKFHSQVNAASQHTLSCCISFNQTFLKKSLQAALRRVTQ